MSLWIQGEPGQTAQKGPFPTPDGAIKDFEKKFSDKTKNKWANRASFKPAAGKYTLLEMAGEDDDDDVVDAVCKSFFMKMTRFKLYN